MALGVAEGAAASDTGALPVLLACGAEQADSARTVNRAAARGRAEIFTSHISVEDSFLLKVHHRPFTTLAAAYVPGVRV